MGLWSMIKGFLGLDTPQDAIHPELVVLLSEPLIASVEFIRGGVEHCLQILLPDTDPNSTEFCAGEFPIFFVQHRGWLIQIKTMPIPYLADECREFVNGDLTALSKNVTATGMAEVLANHQGWISVAVMNDSSDAALADCYYFVGKILGAFALENVVAVVWPAEAKIIPWDDEHLIALMDGKPLPIFAN